MNCMTYPCLSEKTASPVGRERGTALVMAMVILLILTIIGVTALNTTSLEAKMAGNIQDTNFAFEAAESGLASSLTSTLDLYNPVDSGDVSYGRAGARVITTFTAFTPIRRTNKLSNMYGNGFSEANFDQVSTGTVGPTTSPLAQTKLHQGAMQIVPGQNN